MNLSNYCDEQEREWKLEEKATTEKLINYLSALIGKDLYQFEKDFNHADKTSDSIQVFNKLKLWLLNCHQKELLEGLQYVGIDELDFNKKMIFDLATLFTKDAFNKDFVCTILKNNFTFLNLINKFMIFPVRHVRNSHAQQINTASYAI